jgi:ribosome-associated protein YbcJ (S4-like RNA binding protein)
LGNIQPALTPGSRILLGWLLKAFVPDGQPVVIGVDDTVERRRGRKIRDKASPDLSAHAN